MLGSDEPAGMEPIAAMNPFISDDDESSNPASISHMEHTSNIMVSPGRSAQPKQHQQQEQQQPPPPPPDSLTDAETLSRQESLIARYQEEIYWLKLEMEMMHQANESMEERLALLTRNTKNHEANTNGYHSDNHVVVVDCKDFHTETKETETDHSITTIMRSSLKSKPILNPINQGMAKALAETECKVPGSLTDRISIGEKENVRREDFISMNGHDKDNGQTPLVEKNREILRKEIITPSITTGRDQATTTESIGIDSAQKEMILLLSSTDSNDLLKQWKRQEQVTIRHLDRVALLWSRVDESVRGLELTISKVGGGGILPSTQGEQQHSVLLSTLEMASLVHGQVKMALMLVELALRNNIASFKNDYARLSFCCIDSSIEARLDQIQSHAMTSIQQIKSTVEEKMIKLLKQSESEAATVRAALEEKLQQLVLLQKRQRELGGRLRDAHYEISPELFTKRGLRPNEIPVTRDVLVQLQNEVLHVVKRVKEKDDEIDELNTTLNEYKVRERSLTDELKRYVSDSAGRQIREQRRRAARMRLEESSTDSNDQFSSSDDEQITSDHGESIYEEL